ncbi:MAG TPA: ROK family transcriptional regulator [Gemmatimonadaceae bacterium]|nr:ROK family transcriptional regulator [Gemmatimonadaceae bacterium]
MLTGTNLLYTKQYNLRIVHEVIRLHGPISRAEIARRTELTGQTISNLAKELISLGLVSEGERRQEGRGAPSTALAINPGGAYSIGLDFNRDHLTGVLVDLAGSVCQREHVELDLPTPADTLDLMVAMVDRLIERESLPRDRVWGVGIGIPGPMYLNDAGDGYVVNPKSFPGWHKVPLASWLHERLRMPVFLENNATAAAIGERWYGAGQHISTFFYFFFGSGLGGGIITDGRPYEGFTGNAGEIGYLPAFLDGEHALTGDPPHVGLHFNLPLLYAMLEREGAEARRPEDLGELLAAGHPALLGWMDTAASYLTGLALAVEYLIDPEAVFFGGRLPDSVLKGLMDRVAAQLPARRIAEKVATPRLLLATAGVDAAALGVATLPIYSFFAPAPQVLLKQRTQREMRSSAHGMQVRRAVGG